jgi:peptidoglycan/xylan/chitin deacetylase (PgdA/CDA1 family)
MSAFSLARGILFAVVAVQVRVTDPLNERQALYICNTPMQSRVSSQALTAFTVCLFFFPQLYACPAYAATSIPGLRNSERPQLIIFTHDDNTDSLSASYVTEITNKHKNRNGCTIKAAFYTTASLSSCSVVKSLYDAGHEIGEHTKTHMDLYKISAGQKRAEILDGRKFIVSCGIPAADVVGHRSPYLSDDPTVRKILSDAGYLYDTSIPEYYPSKTSPSRLRRLLPYRLSGGIPQDCKYWGNINHCSASERYSNMWELPMWQYQRGDYRAATNDLMDPPNAYTVLKREFDRNYDGNRAPIGIWTHSTTTNYLNNKTNRDQISRFLSYALAKPNTWVVTPRQLIDYMKNPVKASQMAAFMARYKGCSGARAAEGELVVAVNGSETITPQGSIPSSFAASASEATAFIPFIG